MSANWTQLTTTPARAWSCAARSRDGQIIIAGINEGLNVSRLYRSTDGGGTWTQIGDLLDRNWSSVSLSHDGLTGIATIDGGRVYRITGDVLTQVLTDGNWRGSAISGAPDPVTGHYSFMASEFGGRVWRTNSGGGVGGWYEDNPDGNVDAPWGHALAMSADGETVITGREHQLGHSYITTDGGLNWTRSPAGQAGWWRDASMSDDGQVIATVVFKLSGAVLHISRDGGGTWTGYGGSPPFNLGGLTPDFNRVAVSANGRLIVVTANDPELRRRVWVSTDYGDTWVETQPMGDNDRNWTVCNISGARMLVGDAYGFLLAGLQVHSGIPHDVITRPPTVESPSIVRRTRSEYVALDVEFAREIEIDVSFSRSVELDLEFTREIEIDTKLH